jgi:hypothetical protein
MFCFDEYISIYDGRTLFNYLKILNDTTIYIFYVIDS